MAQFCILIVEDDAVLREFLRTLLIKEGYDVLVARDGCRALMKMSARRPDAIIADIMMPNMDGYTFYHAVREQPAWVSIPFIFLTAKDDHDDVMKGKALGAEDYITKPVAVEDLLIILRARLKRSLDIQQAVEVEAASLKEQIVNVLSHELRTPLTFISGYTDLALRDVSEWPDMQFHEFLQGIKRGSDRLLKLVSDLMLVFEIDSGTVGRNFETGLILCEDITPRIAKVVADFSPDAAQKGISLTYEAPQRNPPVRLNTLYFPDALGRLISNSIKFTFGKEGHVRVMVKATGDCVEIAVCDNGVGIAPEHMGLLFKPMHQFNRDKMEQQGLGIGLYIAQQLTHLHGGDISVTSTLNKGSTFTICLPVVVPNE